MGIRGFKRWSASWDRTYKDGERLNLEELNEFKDSLLHPFLPLKEVFSDRQSTVREMTAALAEFLESVEAEKRLSRWEKAFHEMGEAELEKEYSQVYGLVMDLF